MSVNLVYYKDGAKVMRPVTTEEEYRQLRGSSRQVDLVSQARSGDQDAKRRLVQMNYSLGAPLPLPSPKGEGVYTDAETPLKGCSAISMSVGMDVDFDKSAPDYETKMHDVPAMILAKKDELGLLMLERSASKGYHIVFRRHEELTQEENLRWASDLLGVQYDEGAKDVTRVFFTTTDSPEDLLYLDEELFDRTLAEAPLNIDPEEDEEPEPEIAEETHTCELDYDGIPYDKLLAKWWELHYDGKTPIKSNRDTLTFELAVNFRHICGFDRNVMDRVIPCYDGFTHAEKMKCIDSALGEKRSLMPVKLKRVIDAVRKDNVRDLATMQVMEDLEHQDDLTYWNRISVKTLPRGVRDSVMALEPACIMPVITGIAPAIGALATGVKILVHGKPHSLNMLSYIVGEAGSGKGDLDPVIEAWMWELMAMADVYFQKEEEWRSRSRVEKNADKLPEEPVFPVRWLPLNNTVANLAQRLARTDGTHAFSFTPEADTVAQKWKSDISDFSVMVRQAYDGSRYDREARSTEAVNVHIKHLLWNITMCGTPDALHRVIDNYTDGLLSRVAISRMPDNTYSPLPETTRQLTDKQADHIHQVAHLLPLMKGTVELPRLEKASREWLEEIRLEALKNQDKTMARCRMRDHVTAMRIAACIMLCKVCELLIAQYGLTGAERRLQEEPTLWIPIMRRTQSTTMMNLYKVIADSIIDSDLYYFRSELDEVYTSAMQRGVSKVRRGKNHTIYDALPTEFTMEQSRKNAVLIKGVSVTDNAIRLMLRAWEDQGLVEKTESGTYRKLSA